MVFVLFVFVGVFGLGLYWNISETRGVGIKRVVLEGRPNWVGINRAP